MQLNLNNSAIGQPHPGNALALAPSTSAVVPAQARKFSNAGAARDGFDRQDLADDFEVHDTIVANATD